MWECFTDAITGFTRSCLVAQPIPTFWIGNSQISKTFKGWLLQKLSSWKSFPEVWEGIFLQGVFILWYMQLLNIFLFLFMVNTKELIHQIRHFTNNKFHQVWKRCWAEARDVAQKLQVLAARQTDSQWWRHPCSTELFPCQWGNTVTGLSCILWSSVSKEYFCFQGLLLEPSEVQVREENQRIRQQILAIQRMHDNKSKLARFKDYVLFVF